MPFAGIASQPLKIGAIGEWTRVILLHVRHRRIEIESAMWLNMRRFGFALCAPTAGRADAAHNRVRAVVIDNGEFRSRSNGAPEMSFHINE
jgi:hypothetical protein